MIQVVIILVVLLGAGGFGSWTYMQKLQADNEVYRINEQVYAENETKLNDAISDQNEVIAAKAAQAAAIQEANNILRAETDRLDKEKANLAKKLGRHELDILAQNKPGLVGRVINKASDNALRCFEVITGAPLTPSEKEASKPSQYNAECPTIHPNYNKPSEDS